MMFVPERYERTKVLVVQEVGKCSIISNKRVGWIKRVGRTFFFISLGGKTFELDFLSSLSACWTRGASKNRDYCRIMEVIFLMHELCYFGTFGMYVF